MVVGGYKSTCAVETPDLICGFRIDSIERIFAFPSIRLRLQCSSAIGCV